MSDWPFDPYDVLQVARHAEPDVIQAAYRTLARKVHPDLSDDPAAQSRMVLLNRAWEILSDPNLRAHHDLKTTAAQSAAATAASAAPTGSGTEPAPTGSTWRVVRDGEGAAGPPPGRPWGSVLDFGRFLGWSMGEIARIDPGYLEWLERQPSGIRYRAEIDHTLRKTGFRSDRADATEGIRRWR